MISVNSSFDIRRGGALFRLTYVLPFILGAALYLSAVFKPFAALPLMFAHLRFGRLVGSICSLSNLAIVWGISGRSDAAWFFVLAIVLACTFAECIRLKLKIELLVLISIGMMILASALLLVSYSQKVKQSPIGILRSYIGNEVDEFSRNAEKYKASSNISSQDLDRFLVDPETTKKNLLESLPSIALISLLFLVVGNFLVALRLNLNGIKEKMGLKPGTLKKWKAPDHLVWPTILSGFCLLVEIPVVTEVALNLFRVLIAVYTIQGLAILSFFFVYFNVKSYLRPLAYVLAITFFLPFVIGLGFFDLWFNIREKKITTS